jgi:fibronectin-binding autotransporter adhesin
VGNDGTNTTFSGTLVDGVLLGVPIGLTKIGSGTLTLSGTSNTYTGPTTINGGTLSLTGSITNSPATVNSGRTLAGTGTISGSVTIASGGILAAGIPSPTSIGTLTVGSLTLNSGSILNYKLSVPNKFGDTANDLIKVNGNLTLSGATLNITNVGGFSEGVYELFSYTGNLHSTNNGINFGTLPSGFSNQELLLETNHPGVVDLLVSKSGFTDRFWDGPLTAANGVSGGNGGSGTWNNTTTNWTNFNGTVNAPWQSGFVIFAGSGGIVTLGDDINFIGMQFAIDRIGVGLGGWNTLALGARGRGVKGMITFSTGVRELTCDRWEENLITAAGDYGAFESAETTSVCCCPGRRLGNRGQRTRTFNPSSRELGEKEHSNCRAYAVDDKVVWTEDQPG